jgi:hypothetical protein
MLCNCMQFNSFYTEGNFLFSRLYSSAQSLKGYPNEPITIMQTVINHAGK